MKHLKHLLYLLLLLANLAATALMLFAAYSPGIDPRHHPVLSLAGLTFSIFVTVNVCFLLFWLLVRRYRLALLPLAGFLACYGQIGTALPVHHRIKELPEGSIKLLSYNIMHFDGAALEDGRNAILDYLARSGADILCLQEYGTTERKGFLRQRDVDEALHDYPYRVITPLGDSHGQNRMACYSKLPILSSRRLDYPSDYNGSVIYELAWGTDTLTLISNHLESNKLTVADKQVYNDMLRDPEKEKVKNGTRLLVHKLAEASVLRAAQADTIAAEIARSPHPYILVCGDFNDTPISYAHRTIGRRLTDAFAASGRGLGISYNQNRFYFRIDHILTSPNLHTYNCTVDRTIRGSDHYPIWCWIKKK